MGRDSGYSTSVNRVVEILEERDDENSNGLLGEPCQALAASVDTKNQDDTQ